jgi:hypothetical protein
MYIATDVNRMPMAFGFSHCLVRIKEDVSEEDQAALVRVIEVRAKC